jgi:hypothetical protein
MIVLTSLTSLASFCNLLRLALCARECRIWTSDDHLRVALSAGVELLAKCSASVALDVFSPPCQTKDEIVKFINGVIEPETETQLAKYW